MPFVSPELIELFFGEKCLITPLSSGTAIYDYNRDFINQSSVFREIRV